jgi:prevent-host-death family protein
MFLDFFSYLGILELINQLMSPLLVEEDPVPKGREPMTKRIPAFLARTQFGQILNRVSRGQERFVVTKNGEATAVILGMEDFLRSVVKTPKSLTKLQQQAKQSGADKLTLEEIEAEIAAVWQEKTRAKA